MTHLSIAPDMTTLIDCLDQGECWQDDDGSWRPIHNMPIGRALRLLGGLELRATSLALARTVQTASELAQRLPEGCAPDERLAADIENAADQVRERQADPCRWLRRTPFYRALAARLMAEFGWVEVDEAGMTS